MKARELNFAYKVRHVLNENLDNLPKSYIERLMSARNVALSHKKKGGPWQLLELLELLAIRPALVRYAGHFFNEPFSWLGRLGVVAGVVAPLLIGVVLFVGLYQYEEQHHISETADFDVMVLVDELPLTAYLDHGFNAYLAKQRME